MGDDKDARSGHSDMARSPWSLLQPRFGESSTVLAKVSPATRQAVQAAIKTLHYEPNKFARSLITNRSGIIEMIDRSIRLCYGERKLVQLEEYTSLRDICPWLL